MRTETMHFDNDAKMAGELPHIIAPGDVVKIEAEKQANGSWKVTITFQP